MSESTDLLLYDDACPMCTFQSRLITWLDWFDTVRLTPLSSATPPAAVRSVELERLREAVHCIDADGRVWRGARALRRVGLRMPLMAPFAALLYVPGITQIAERTYMLVSRNRHVLSKLFGCKQACSVLPGRRREQDHAG